MPHQEALPTASKLQDFRKQGILTNDPVDSNFLAPVGSLRSRGIEFDASVKLAPHWQIVAAYVKIKAAMEYAFSPQASVRLEADNLLVVKRKASRLWWP